MVDHVFLGCCYIVVYILSFVRVGGEKEKEVSDLVFACRIVGGMIALVILYDIVCHLLFPMVD